MRFANLLAIGAVASSASAFSSGNDAMPLISREEISVSSVVVYSTRLHTITSCAEGVTNCPVVTSIVDATTTVCPVTESDALSVTALPNPTTSAPLQTLTVPSTMTNDVATLASSVSPEVPESSRVSPEEAAISNSTLPRSTSLVYSTVTLATNGSSPSSAPPSPVNSTVLPTTAVENTPSSNVVRPVTATASHNFSISANGTLTTATAPGTVPIELIVPYTGGSAAGAMALSLLAAAALAACIFMV